MVDVARVPQGERRRATRARLTAATVACLPQHGCTGASTTRVDDRAGVSRGAQLHHFPTKNDLVLAAIDHLTTLRAQEVTPDGDLPDAGVARARRVLEQLSELFTGPTFQAALELWVAA